MLKKLISIKYIKILFSLFFICIFIFYLINIDNIKKTIKFKDGLSLNYVKLDNITEVQGNEFPFKLVIEGKCKLNFHYINSLYFQLDENYGRRGEASLICDDELKFNIDFRNDYNLFENNEDYQYYKSINKFIKT